MSILSVESSDGMPVAIIVQNVTHFKQVNDKPETAVFMLNGDSVWVKLSFSLLLQRMRAEIKELKNENTSFR